MCYFFCGKEKTTHAAALCDNQKKFTTRKQQGRMVDIPQLAQQCAPDIPPAVIVAIATKESSGNQYAIGHPSYPKSKQPKSFDEAKQAIDALAESGARYDAGLMQISSDNFSWLGLDNTTVLYPCRNIAAARDVILAGIAAEGANATTFFNTVSRYNSGNARTGYRNGYVADVAVNLLNPKPQKLKSDTTSPAVTAQPSPATVPNTIRPETTPDKPVTSHNSWTNGGLFSNEPQRAGLFTQVAKHETTADNNPIFHEGGNVENAAVVTLQRLDNSNQQRTGYLHAADAHRTAAMEVPEPHSRSETRRNSL